ncbi:MAG: thymidylate synthase [Proteobacteria bacterium]|nr:thymidylate synthase [Pseudomonadota bacterium]MBU4258879.1 thymidylate synthase [Pseudomonadota bacterium]MBU4288926.1 thymidylate synthase [Pseudomonadota bacterium]MBU4415269.1 thymidylate synthase [Pseudomonadota bacterium]
MNIISIEARDIPDAWYQSVYSIISKGHRYKIDRGSYEGQERLEFDYITVHIKHPGIRPLLPDIPPSLGIPNPVADGYLEEYLPYLMTSEKQPNEDYTYGQYLESQIEEVIRLYKEDGHGTNQAYMTVGNPEALYLKDPPCLRGIDTRIRYGKLHFMVYFRSWDLWGGFPANLGAIQMLKEYMAEEIGVEDGEIIAASKGLHLYDYIWELAKLRTMQESSVIDSPKN